MGNSLFVAVTERGAHCCIKRSWRQELRQRPMNQPPGGAAAPFERFVLSINILFNFFITNLYLLNFYSK